MRGQQPKEHEVLSWDKQTPVHSDVTSLTYRDKTDNEMLRELQREIARLQNEMRSKDEQYMASTQKLLQNIELLVEEQKNSKENAKKQIEYSTM